MSAIGFAAAGEPAKTAGNIEVLPVIKLDPGLPAPRPVPQHNSPVSPYGPAIPGVHPAATAVAPYVGEPAPAPRDVGGSTLPSPGSPVPGITSCEYTSPWANTPAIQPFPRLGMFLVPPTGPGYYSGIDLLHGNLRDKPPTLAYPAAGFAPPSGFDYDYRYLDKPDYVSTDPLDAIKRMHPTPDTMVTIGGESRARYMNEIDPRLATRNNEYMLYRNRVWADLWYTDSFRIYGEFISAIIDGNELVPLPIDKNEADFLNLFVEVKVCEFGGAPVYVRAGRQELLFGSERLISTLDWANTRRTFEGVRAFRRTEELDVDVFAVRPVVINPTTFDKADDNALFYGVWTTYRPMKGTTIDFYYLGLRNDTQAPDRYVPTVRGDLGIYTYGARWAGNVDNLLYDFEGMYQNGERSHRDVSAYAYTAALGWEFAEHAWRPQAWISYDYASGTNNPLGREDHTFNQLFPFGHYYLGWIDLVGRQNIEDLSCQVAAFPEPWVTLIAQGHHFQLAESRDFLYNAAGLPTRRSPLGIAGRDVGNEVDVLANFHLTPHQDLVLGYSKLFAGDFIRKTGANVSPELFYAMYNIRW
jgi:hypothetical protein